MPTLGLTYCLRPGCTKRSAKAYCEEHQSRKLADEDRHRGSSTERGYGARWQKLRRSILRRDDYACVPCMRDGLVIVATEVDHIIPKQHGGTNSPDNLQSICKTCHGRKTAEEKRSWVANQSQQR